MKSRPSSVTASSSNACVMHHIIEEDDIAHGSVNEIVNKEAVAAEKEKTLEYHIGRRGKSEEAMLFNDTDAPLVYCCCALNYHCVV